VRTVDGHFSVVLGPFDETARSLQTVFESGSGRYLEISVDSNPAIAPRQQLLSAPYAIQAQKSQQSDIAAFAVGATTANSAAAVHGASGVTIGTDAAPNAIEIASDGSVDMEKLPITLGKMQLLLHYGSSFFVGYDYIHIKTPIITGTPTATSHFMVEGFARGAMEVISSRFGTYGTTRNCIDLTPHGHAPTTYTSDDGKLVLRLTIDDSRYCSILLYGIPTYGGAPYPTTGYSAAFSNTASYY
jgi:hypothetical protein